MASTGITDLETLHSLKEEYFPHDTPTLPDSVIYAEDAELLMRLSTHDPVHGYRIVNEWKPVAADETYCHVQEVNFKMFTVTPRLDTSDRAASHYLTPQERDMLFRTWLYRGFSPAVSIHPYLQPAQDIL
jgi:hypothetical protein